MENPWNIQSLYELQYFNCPSCIFKNHSKQELVNHAYETHPECIEYLMNINDKSIIDLIFPWNEPKTEIVESDHLKVKIETKYEDFDDYSNEITEHEMKTEDDFINDSSSSIKTEEFKDNTIQNAEININPYSESTHHHYYYDATRLTDFHEGVTYKCNLCEKSFTKAEHLRKHVKRVHEEKNIYACNHCEKRFSQSHHFKRHIKAVHEGVKDHVCGNCGKSFTESKSLTRHIKSVHEGVKDHHCNLCGKGFSRPDKLKEHVKAIHEGVRDHVCNLCGNSFTEAWHLNDHIKTFHQIGSKSKNFKCSYCEMAYVHKGDFNRHTMKVHNIDMRNKDLVK